MRGVVAAGHPVSAEAGARVLRAGGNAVDAVIGAALSSWVAEPLLTGPGAGGYLLVAGPGVEPTLLDFFVAAPSGGDRSGLTPVDVLFEDAHQVFHVGPASIGVPGVPAGLEAAAQRWGSWPLERLAAPAAAQAREGVALNAQQAYVFEILAGILTLTPEAARLFAPAGEVLGAGDHFRAPQLAATIERFGRDGAAPFYRGDIAEQICAQVAAGGGTLDAAGLRAYEVAARTPARVAYQGREVLTNPPPSAGGILLALALGQLARRADRGRPPTPRELLHVMDQVQGLRTPAFDDGLPEPGFLDRFLAANLGSTTHLSVLDADGLACSMTCTNGEGAGIIAGDTGIHLNNVMGEEDLSPQGFFTIAAGRRMPSMMSPTIVLDEHGEVELVLGSAGSNRIRSAILQTIVAAVDRGLGAQAAIDAPRLHAERGIVYAEPGVELDHRDLDAAAQLVPFRARNLFFGGVQAVRRDPRSGEVSAGGDPRRGGAVAFA